MSPTSVEISLARVFVVPPGTLGLTVKFYGSNDGALVIGISNSCPFRSSIRVGDRLVTMNGARIKSESDLAKGKNSAREFGVVKLPLSRNAADFTRGQSLQLKPLEPSYFNSLELPASQKKYGGDFLELLSPLKREWRSKDEHTLQSHPLPLIDDEHNENPIRSNFEIDCCP